MKKAPIVDILRKYIEEHVPNYCQSQHPQMRHRSAPPKPNPVENRCPSAGALQSNFQEPDSRYIRPKSLKFPQMPFSKEDHQYIPVKNGSILPENNPMRDNGPL